MGLVPLSLSLSLPLPLPFCEDLTDEGVTRGGHGIPTVLSSWSSAKVGFSGRRTRRPEEEEEEEDSHRAEGGAVAAPA